jgi:hypothetical protein
MLQCFANKTASNVQIGGFRDLDKTLTIVSRDSVVGIATSYELDK